MHLGTDSVCIHCILDKNDLFWVRKSTNYLSSQAFLFALVPPVPLPGFPTPLLNVPTTIILPLGLLSPLLCHISSLQAKCRFRLLLPAQGHVCGNEVDVLFCVRGAGTDVALSICSSLWFPGGTSSCRTKRAYAAGVCPPEGPACGKSLLLAGIQTQRQPW